MRLPTLLLAATLFLAGCATPADDAASGPGAATPPALPQTLGLTDCAATLQVWLVPLEELRSRTPPEFPPAALREADAVDTPMGRLVFYLWSCEGPEPASIGLLSVRVVPPDDVAPPTDRAWAPMYVLQTYASGPALAAAQAAGLPVALAEASVAIEQTVPLAGNAASSVSVDGAEVFRSSVQGLPDQTEDFSRPERHYFMGAEEIESVTWIDTDFRTTLAEGEGRVEYADGSPFAQAVGRRAYDAAVDHHYMRGDVTLVTGAASR